MHVLPPTDTRCVLYGKPLIFLRNTTLRRENSASRGCSINIKNTRVFPKNNRIYPLFFSPRHESAAIRPLRHGRRVHWSQRRRSPYPPPLSAFRQLGLRQRRTWRRAPAEHRHPRRTGTGTMATFTPRRTESAAAVWFRREGASSTQKATHGYGKEHKSSCSVYTAILDLSLNVISPWAFSHPTYYGPLAV